MFFVHGRNFHTIVPDVARTVLRDSRPMSDLVAANEPAMMKIGSPEEAVAFWPELDDNPFTTLTSALDALLLWNEDDAARVRDLRAVSAFAGKTSLVMPFIDSDGRVGIHMSAVALNVLSQGCYITTVLLQKYIAALLGRRVGKFFATATMWFADAKAAARIVPLITEFPAGGGPYDDGVVAHSVVDVAPDRWLAELRMFASEGPALGYESGFIRRVALPMRAAWRAYDNTPSRAGEAAKLLAGNYDWLVAGRAWLERRRRG